MRESTRESEELRRELARRTEKRIDIKDKGVLFGQTYGLVIVNSCFWLYFRLDRTASLIRRRATVLRGGTLFH